METVIGLGRVGGKNGDPQGLEDDSRVCWTAEMKGRGKAKDLTSIFISER